MYILMFLMISLIHPREINITQTPLEQLLKIKVTSASKKEEDVETVPASVFVLTQEQIKASGATTLPQVLRLIPGIYVAKVDASKWAVGIRGLGSRATQHLLVMRDGRSLYDPLFSGTFWEIEDYLLEDIERIEVVRGPGGAVWGANAVNGVINIITKSSRDTQGTMLHFGAGNEEKGFGSFRVGAKMDAHTTARAYGKYIKKDAGYGQPEARDAWEFHQMGFRMDKRKNTLRYSLAGDYYQGDIGENSADPSTANHEGGNLLFKSSLEKKNAEYFFNAYYDYRFLDHLSLDEERHSYDMEFRHQTSLFNIHALHWGLEYRVTRDRIPIEINTSLPPQFRTDIKPRERTDHLYQLFFQDDIAIIPKLHLIIGSKLEHNSYTEWELQPSVRTQYLPHPSHTIWSAISRAVRVPSRLESDIYVGDVQTGENFDSENLTASELGYHFSGKKWKMDVSGFYNIYTGLLTQEIDSNNIPFFENKLDGTGYGGELVLNWQILEQLNFLASYSYLELNFDLHPESADSTKAERLKRASPEHQAGWQMLYSPLPAWNFGAFLRYVDGIAQPVNNRLEKIDEYLELDLSLAYSPTRKVRVSIAVSDLLHEHHAEQKASGSSEVERSIYGKVALWF